MGPDDSDDCPGDPDGRRARLLPETDGTVGHPVARSHQRGACGRPAARSEGRACGWRWTMTSFAATIPILIVVLSAVAALLAEAIRRPGARLYLAGFGLIGLAGALLASCFLWYTNAVTFGFVPPANSSPYLTIVP